VGVATARAASGEEAAEPPLRPGDWLDLLLRWSHLIAGIAWIGSSFYFIWLDQHLEPPQRSDGDVTGSLWMVHSGGFYRVERRRIGPGQLPPTLHWFKWEAALTWITGILLLGVVYDLSGGLFLIDSPSTLSPGAAAGVALGIIALGWFVYDGLWQSPLGRRRPAAATALSLVLAAAATWAFCRLLSGRAAFVHVGALLGTLMVANVWVRILPAQQRMIDATAAGRTPDFTEGERAKRRSVHNSYMTLPVLFMMLSNHFPAVYAAPLNAVVLVLLVIAGAAARHVMIGHGAGRAWAIAPALAALLGVGLLTRPAAELRGPLAAAHTPGPVPAFAEVQAIVQSRCGTCHSRVPSAAGFASPPAGVMFDEPRDIRRLAMRIYLRAVVTKTMPLANVTGITDQERAVLARWVEHGALAK
jgi:uncharacterized membrane protein